MEARGGRHSEEANDADIADRSPCPFPPEDIDSTHGSLRNRIRFTPKKLYPENAHPLGASATTGLTILQSADGEVGE